MNEALPPMDLDAEENLLGGMMLNDRVIEKVLDVDITRYMFYRESHGAIFNAIVSLHSRSQPVDSISVVNELTRHGGLDAAGGTDRVHEIATLVPAASNAPHYAGIVRAKWLERELRRIGMEIQSMADDTGSVADKISEADTLLFGLANQAPGRKTSTFTAPQLVADFRSRMARQEADGGVATPFPTFLSPWKAARLYVAGGYQGDGKSVFAVQSLRAACEAGARVGFATLEMDRRDLTDRLISTFGVPHHLILNRTVGNYRDVVEPALEEIAGWDFEIIDDEEIDPEGIRRAQRKGKYDFLIVDHLHRMRYDRRHQRASVGANVIAINNIARKFEIPVLLLAQLRRGSSHDPFPRPTMADFRETSEIESEASMCLFVWRQRDKNERTTDAELIVGKNRFGSEGYLNLTFRPSCVKFEVAHQTGGMA